MKAQLQAFGMGDFSDDEVAQIETLLAAIDPMQMLHNFGFEKRGATDQNCDSLAAHLEEPLADRLASLIAELLKRLSDADPAKVFKKPNWLQRTTGKFLETSLDYLEARLRIDGLLEEAATAATQLEVLLGEIDKQRQQLRNEIRDLRLHLAAGRLYLARDPGPLTSPHEANAFDVPEERFARRLTNLAALLASHEMTAIQLDLAHAQTADLLDRYYESCRVLVPIWRGHSLGLILGGENVTSRVSLAQQAYLALKNNLSQFA